MGPLLAIFPHPDDETFTAGGVMAAAVDRGVTVTVVSATRGEAGESAVPGLDPDRLGGLREVELRNAMRQLGVTDVRLLGYRDSGMEGSVDANHPNAFVGAPTAEVAVRLAALIRELRPQTVVTFGAEGVYGHPDHRHIHDAVVEAVSMAADPARANLGRAEPWRTPALFFGTAPREAMQALLDQPEHPLGSLSDAARANLGTPRAEITHEIDVTPWAERKRAALGAHYTQTGEGGPLSDLPADEARRWLSREFFVRAALPWGTLGEPGIIDRLAEDSAGS